MALHRIASFSFESFRQFDEPTESRQAVVYRDSEWNEYRVKFYRDMQYQTNADYHDDDKESAIQTAQHFVNTGK